MKNNLYQQAVGFLMVAQVYLQDNNEWEPTDITRTTIPCSNGLLIISGGRGSHRAGCCCDSAGTTLPFFLNLSPYGVTTSSTSPVPACPSVSTICAFTW